MNIHNVKEIGLPYIKENGRMLDYYLILNLFEKNKYDDEVLIELLKYQNEDGGFGNGLEPDVQAPHSSILATDVAIDILATIKTNEKEPIIERMIQFIESKFNKEDISFEFVPKEKDDYPHAVWWNDVKEFGYFNPTPEVIGFLYQNKKYVTKFDVDELVIHMINEIKSPSFMEIDSEHSLYSVMKFCEFISEEYKKEVKDILVNKVDELIGLDESKWDFYSPQPYKFYMLSKELFDSKYDETLIQNFKFLETKLTTKNIWMPDWKWFQYDEIFESDVKYQWMGYVTHERLKTMIEFGYIIN